jgi:hypothetical protein
MTGVANAPRAEAQKRPELPLVEPGLRAAGDVTGEKAMHPTTADQAELITMIARSDQRSR